MVDWKRIKFLADTSKNSKYLKWPSLLSVTSAWCLGLRQKGWTHCSTGAVCIKLEHWRNALKHIDFTKYFKILRLNSDDVQISCQISWNMLRNVTNYRGNFSFGDVCQVFSLKIYLASSWFLTQYLRQCTDKSDLLWEIVNFGLHVAQDVLANRLSVILIGFCELLENFL